MKDKVKDSLLIIGIGYFVVIICLMYYSYFTSNKYIYFDQSKSLTAYKERVSKIEEESCKNYLNSFIDYIDSTNNIEKITFQDYFNKIYLTEDSILSYVLKGKEACSKITEEDLSELGLYFLNASVAEDSVLNYYNFQYEIRLPDILVRNIMEPSTVSVNNLLKYRNEIKALELELDILESSEVLNEE